VEYFVGDLGDSKEESEQRETKFEEGDEEG